MLVSYQISPPKLQEAFNDLHKVVLELLYINRKLLKERETLKSLLIDLITNDITQKTYEKINLLSLEDLTAEKIDKLIKETLAINSQFLKLKVWEEEKEDNEVLQ